MVGRGYMVEQLPPPSAFKRFIDLRMIPAAIDIAGAVEAVLERVAVQTRGRPVTSVGLAFGGGCGLAWLIGR